MQRGEVGKAGQGKGWEEMRENSSKAISFGVCRGKFTMMIMFVIKSGLSNERSAYSKDHFL